MKTLPEKLESLAVILDKKAELHDAIAVDHEMNKETQQGQQRRRRAASARQYAVVSREAAKVISGRQQAAAKRAKFVPPTLQELYGHCAEHLPSWPAIDQRAWHDHFTSVGWKVNTKQMIDWKAAARNGYRNWQEKGQPATRAGTGPNGYVPPSDGHF